MPEFAVLLDALVKNQAAQLWLIAKPLMHQQTPKDWEDLLALMYETYSIATDIASTTYEWRYDFAAIGSPYHTNMINRDPFLRGNDEDLVRQNAVVRLGIRPAVYVRDSKDGVLLVAQLTQHHVLVKGQ
jgi:hypothetical protein